MRFVWRKTKHKLPKGREWSVLPQLHEKKVSFKQAASVNRLVGTLISDGTQRLLAKRGYHLRVMRSAVYGAPSKLLAVRHMAGVEGYDQE